MRVLVTGGLGFVGSAVIRHLISETDHQVLNVDKCTYAASPGAVATVATSARYSMVEGDIGDQRAMVGIVAGFDPDAVIHLAAETHVDRSIADASVFIETNLVGSFTMLQAAKSHWEALPPPRRERFRFLHVSTDEVFGSLEHHEPAFTESSAYAPRSPYAASKAGSDHLAAAWHHTFGLPVVITNCSNNYGPYQFPDKLIPLMLARAVRQLPLPVYGQGDNIRDWLYVADHAGGLVSAVERAAPGERFVMGGDSERTNLAVVETLCDLLDERRPEGSPHRRLISFVDDRPGHDRRYGIDSSEIQRRLGWKPTVSFTEGLAMTIDWYLDNRDWWESILDDRYGLERLGKVTRRP